MSHVEIVRHSGIVDKNDDSKESLSRLLNQSVTSGSAGDLEIIEYLNTNFSTIESLENVD